ncbi:MAG: hypothetical protein WD960_09560 [Gemmatimonadota bacterium]
MTGSWPSPARLEAFARPATRAGWPTEESFDHLVELLLAGVRGGGGAGYRVIE